MLRHKYDTVTPYDYSTDDKENVVCLQGCVAIRLLTIDVCYSYTITNNNDNHCVFLLLVHAR